MPGCVQVHLPASGACPELTLTLNWRKMKSFTEDLLSDSQLEEGEVVHRKSVSELELHDGEVFHKKFSFRI